MEERMKGIEATITKIAVAINVNDPKNRKRAKKLRNERQQESVHEIHKKEQAKRFEDLKKRQDVDT